MACHEWIAAVEVLDAEHLLNASDTFFGWRDGLLLLVKEVVSATFGAGRTCAQSRHELGEGGVEVL